ncbi:MAG: preprotein translocase subunit YajC [Bacteroidales bacterium]
MLHILLQAPDGAGGATGNFILLIGIMVIFFLFIVRPQMKRQKETRKFREALQKGDKVLTLGGIHAKVIEIKENNTVVIEIAKEVQVKVDKSALVQSPEALAQGTK